MKPTLRYWVYQIPGILLLGAVLFPLVLYDLVEIGTALLVMALWIIKDAILFPFLRDSYKIEQKQGVAVLVGKTGVLESDLKVRGWMRLRGELWQAALPEGAPPLSRGETVRVVAVQGMVLVVEKPEPRTEYGDEVYDEEEK